MRTDIGSKLPSKQFYMSLENQQEEDPPSDNESHSHRSPTRTKPIRKSPKPPQREGLSEPGGRLFPLAPPEFRVFESEEQKHQRMSKFWKEDIDTYYRRQVGQQQKQLLQSLLEEQVGSLRDTIQNLAGPGEEGGLPFEELFRYLELVRHCRSQENLLLLEGGERKMLAVFEGRRLERLVEVSAEEAYLVGLRQRFISGLIQRQMAYNRDHESPQYLSQISTEIAFLLYLMNQNNSRVSQQVALLHQRMAQLPRSPGLANSELEDRYVACLIRKNLRLAVERSGIDEINFYTKADYVEQYGVLEPEHVHLLKDRREFEEYLKRKKSKKGRKNPKAVLRTACAGCLSTHYEQYNPLAHCPECHLRFHKHCYALTLEGVCEPCLVKKGPPSGKGRVECQLCSNRGLLPLPARQMREGVSIHIFCMLVNGLWRYHNGSLEFQPGGDLHSQDSHNDHCDICKAQVYTYSCQLCPRRAHPLCAYLQGWQMGFDGAGKVQLACCAPGLNRQALAYQRKFTLNYKKMLFKNDRDK